VTGKPIILSDVPFAVDSRELRESLALPGEGDLDRELSALIEAAREVARPRAAYRPCFVDSTDGDTTTIEGVTFKSRVLCVNLQEAHRVFPFVATCGRELAAWSASVSDPLSRYWADQISELAARAALSHLAAHLDSGFALSKASSMSPGSLEDWPITEQAPLFHLLGGIEELVGVTLTESFLMIPQKSVSGIRFPLETSFESCMLCQRDACSGRRAPFDPELFSRRYAAGDSDV
jgi:hypothetical protein